MPDVIPELHETIRLIFDKLAEAERGNISHIMKITIVIITLKTENFKIPVDKSLHSVTMFIEYVKV
ncbi:MAG: hypothetical protein WAV28_02540 [Sedimentisphaerales bacterium]|jgi:hypothetical protein